jgi:Galactose oxidase, central domain
MASFLWTERADFGPVARRGAAMAYDSARGVTVMFGGDPGTGTFLGDTWEWDGKVWAQVSDMGPIARAYAGMVFAADEKACVLFGGQPTSGGGLGDTWRWDGTAWTQILDSGPTARALHGMAYDSNRDRVVLFGGLSGSGLGDTWEFDGTAWTEQNVTGPAGRSGMSMAFDDAGKRTVLFGGADNTGKPIGDTWRWDGQKWAQIAEFGPAARYNAAMSGGQGSLVLMGGIVSTSPKPLPAGDTWQLSGNLWAQLENIGPGPLSEAVSALDSARSVIVLFGGVTAAALTGNTWEGPLPMPPLAVLSAALQMDGNLLVTSITLNRPAPAGGVLVNVSLTNQGQTVVGSPTQLSAAAGQTAVGTFESSLPAGTYILTAQIPGTPAVSGSITF